MHGTGTIPGVSLAAVPLCLSVPPVHRAEQAASSGVGVREAPAQTRPRPRQEDGLCEAYSSDMAAAPGASEDAQLLLNVGLIEKDTNGEALWVWCYPYISAEFRELLLRKCRLREDKPRPLYSFLYGQYKRLWFYIMLTHVAGASVLHQVTHFCLALVAKDYNPEKYAAFSRTLSRVYIKNGSPVPMVESYISVLTKGVCQSEENGTFVSRDYDQLKAYTSGSIRDVVSQFGMETVILYTALMLKKRIAVFHPKLEVVQEFTRVLPALVWHRQDWSILHPYVHLIQEETEDLKTCPGYIAGFHNSDVSNRPDLYDVYVNLAESSISVSQSAKGYFCEDPRDSVHIVLLGGGDPRWRLASHKPGAAEAEEITSGHRELLIPTGRGRADATDMTCGRAHSAGTLGTRKGMTWVPRKIQL
ncbi:DENN domain-containing protein 10 isoform X2 [Pseudophryne corroboree]|uniref:DENN domain-containing protein 10 isoform X2 n=1 Tax=Pseudophryne corroboree TaxID=495146 RepID=UPI0030818633